MPVRKVSNHGRNIIGYFPSIKMKRMVAFESTIERDLLYVLDFAQQVESFSEQPCVIAYLDGENERTYTPDFLISLAHSVVLAECKPKALTDTVENQRKFDAGRAWCKKQLWNFEVVTDEQLRNGYRLKAIKFLTQYARHQLPQALKYQITQYLHDRNEATAVIDIAKALMPREPRMLTAATFQMVYEHELTMDLDEWPVGLNTEVEIASPGMNYDEFTAFLN